MTSPAITVLLVIDVQVGVLDGMWNAETVIRNVGIAVEKARSSSVPIIWVQHSDEELIQGSPEHQIVPQLSPLKDELVITKHFNSAFQQTDLEDALSALGATHLILCGAATNWCVRATAFSALERCYDITLVKDAHTTEDMDMGDGTTILARDIVRELNVGIKWVSYPDRSNDTVAVEKLSFAPASA